MRVLGLDLGRRRIGLAVSDPGGELALPLGVLERRGLASDLEALRALCTERAIDRVVVGWPVHLSGRVGPEAEAAERFAARLAQVTGLPTELLDERWTTREAERGLRAAGARGRRRRAALDAAAATILLRTWLERRARERAREEAGP
jgi:putative Holliday junction resolvase